jgi:hypothetical protein
MSTPANVHEKVHTIWFVRDGENPVHGWLRVRGTRPDKFELKSPNYRIPEDVHRAAETAMKQLEEGEWPTSYFQALATMQSVTQRQIWDSV